MDEHNPYYVHIRGGKPIKLWTNKLTSPHPAHVEPEALQQLENVSRLPFIFKHVAAMPDCHWGMGATIGSVIATKGAIIPAAVGVDIGCGMMAVQTTLKAKDLPYTLAGLRSDLERAIPVGGPGVTGSWSEAGRYGPPASVSNRWRTLSDRWKVIAEKYPVLEKGATVEQLGTLGTGNHFIEVCLDEDQSVWVMLHSGSRGLGGRVGKFFIDKAKGEMKKWYIHLEDTNLSYLTEGSEYFNDYVQAVDFAQEFAAENRQAMMERALGVMHKILPPFQRTKMAVNCHHNYVARENHFGENVIVTRKGAVRARLGDLGIIPGSMGDRSFIVRGMGEPDSFQSCSHGAGRRMSRTEAKKTFTIEDHEKATQGIECRKDAEVIDETPGAYKSIEEVMASQKDLVEIVHTLKQIVVVKG